MDATQFAKELETKLDALKAQFETKNAEKIEKAVNEFTTEFTAQFETKMAELKAAKEDNFNQVKDQVNSLLELKNQFQTLQAQADATALKLKHANTTGANGVELTGEKLFVKSLQNALKENHPQLKLVRKGAGLTLEVKAVGDMTVAANLTGDPFRTYQPGVANVPAQKINFDQLVPTVQSATGVYTVFRETGSEGSISSTTAGSAKSQIDYDLSAITFNATYIAGFARYDKSMAQDLPFLTTFLPFALRRDYYKAENAQFYAGIKAAATASTADGTLLIERIIQDIGNLEGLDYDANGIVIHPSAWAEIAITKPSDFSLPRVVNIDNGVLTVNGVPVFKASWVGTNDYIVGDWNLCKKVVVDGLAVEFFEQDADNVTKNAITARVEQRTVLAIDRPNAFILGEVVVTP
jgi:HK97 family phage major capsid protein